MTKLKDIEYDTSGRWVRAEFMDAYTKSVVEQCIELIKQSPTNTQSNADIVNDSVNLIKQYFKINE
jgi:hypothetical protein